MSGFCPICNFQLENDHDPNVPKTTERYYTNCPRCGKFYISRSLFDDLQHNSSYKNNQKQVATVSHAIQKMQNSKDPPFIQSYLFGSLLKTSLPDLHEQINNFILWIGRNTSPGKSIWVNAKVHQSVTGAESPEGCKFVLEYLYNNRLVEGDESPTQLHDDYQADFLLSFEGWNYHDQLVRGAIDSRKAFMAMKYGDPELDEIVDEFFKPAVSATGFELVRLDDRPEAGLIDNRLRVEIRTSRFLISDLTHDNLGAYWEAGFAEGLGKPVIYTCEKEKFNEKKTHFDTNHQLTIIWDKKAPEKASEELKATIRATLPSEAKLTDD